MPEPSAPSPVAPGAPASSDEPARPRRLQAGDVVALVIVGALFALPLRGLLRAPGPPMEEGFMLVFPERLLRGELPNRDFLHLYGPGSLWALAGTYKAFGVSLLSQRLFALAQEIAVAIGVYLLARRWNRVLATFAAVIATIILVPFGLTALAWVGAIGLGVLACAAGIQARAVPDDRRGDRWAIVAGVLFGAALLFRLDLVVAVTLSLLALGWGLAASRRNRLVAALAGVVIPGYLLHALTAGAANVWNGMLIDPVFNLRGGRRLPLPPPWSHLDGFLQRAGRLQQLSWPIPKPSTSQELFLWFFALFAAIAVLLVQAWRSHRADPNSVRARTLVVVALFSLGILPQAVQRVDSAHLAWVSCVPFAFIPVALFEMVEPRVHARRVSAIVGSVFLVVMLLVIPEFTITRYADYSLQTFGVHRNSFLVEQDGRRFYYGKKSRADAADAVVAEAARITEPGQRVFVGPRNLRRTPYSDAFIYYLLPDLVPGTYYIEMDPGMANAEGSGLAEDLANSDIAILSAIWDDWDEPNDSRKDGSAAAEQVLAEHFCLVGTYDDLYDLYRRCR